VEWTEIYGFRNIVAHEYSKIKMSEVWQMIQEDLLKLRVDIERILKKIS